MRQKFNKELLDSVKQKGFYPYERMCDFEKFNETLPIKNKFYTSLSEKEPGKEEYQHVLKVSNKFKRKTNITICT